MRKDTSDNRNKRKSRKRSTSAASKETTFKSQRRSKQLSQVENDDRTIEATPLHENFRDYTPEELLQIKKEVCLAHRCPYLCNIGVKKVTPQNTICNYILMAGHSRGCMPDVCTHYNDPNVKKHLYISAYSNQ